MTTAGQVLKKKEVDTHAEIKRNVTSHYALVSCTIRTERFIEHIVDKTEISQSYQRP
jgi:hypothetical protein